MSIRRTFLCALVLVGGTASLHGCASAEPVASAERITEYDVHRSFLAAIGELQGYSYEGGTDLRYTPDGTFEQARLTMRVEYARPLEARIAFHVNNDQSRTWIITLDEHGLLLKHDHRNPDGSPAEITNYGGFAMPGGSTWFQEFAADEETAAMIPEAAGNVWTLAFDRQNNAFIYDLHRDDQPRYRAVFDLNRPIR